MKRLLTVFLCLSLLLGSVTALAAGHSGSVERSNVSDTDAPDIIKIVCKEKTLKPGDTLHVQVKADDRSSVQSIHVQFENKDSNYSDYSDCISLDLSYNAGSDMFVGEYKISESDPNGNYILDFLLAADKYGNSIYIWDSLKGSASFKVTGSVNPCITINGTARIKENGTTVNVGDTIHVEVKPSKAVENADLIIAYIKSQKLNQWKECLLQKQSSTLYTGTLTFEQSDFNGEYKLSSVLFKNSSWNTIARLETTGQSVKLTGAANEIDSPVISSASVTEKGKKLKPGNTVHVSAKLSAKSGIQSAYAYFTTENNPECHDSNNTFFKAKSNGAFTVDLKYNQSTKLWEGSAQLPKSLPDGKYAMTIDVTDNYLDYTTKSFENIYFDFKGPDYVDDGMKAFITVCWNAIWKKNPTSSEINKYGMPLATGKQKAADVIQTLMKKSKLSGNAAAEALWQIMQGKAPSASEKSKTATALKKSLDNGIDSLNNSAFRKRCKEWGINAGNLGTKTANTKVSSVDIDGGHYVLNGSKAILTGVTDKKIKKLVIQDTVKANGKTYKVTAIDSIACEGLAKLTTLTIGKNVTSIGQEAFNNCKKLKTINVKTTKLKTIGADAFAGIKSSATFNCPKKQLSKYKKLFLNKGKAPKKAKFK